jgi:hypothetical protein
MSFFLNEEQEVALNEFLNEENLKVCNEQIDQTEIPKEFRDLIEKTIETGSPVPFFDPRVGYYTVSFTPTENGNRIYVHHHLSGVSAAIFDPSTVTVTVEEEEEEPVDSDDPVETKSVQFTDENDETDKNDTVSNVVETDDGIYLPT